MNLEMPKSKIEAYKIMSDIMKGYFTTDELVKFLIASKTSELSRGILRGYLVAICDSGIYKLDTKLFDKPIIDIVGTGGDGQHTVNISTLAAFICAATDLVYVAKYGNKSASGICGSMDLLEGLEINIELSEEQIINQLKTVGFVSLYARAIYQGGKFVAEARQKVGRPTIFNLLFPLARPIIGDQYFVFGCATQSQIDTVEKIYSKEQNVRCLIVRGLDQTDEISISGSGKTRYRLIDNKRVKYGVLSCKKLFGVSPANLSSLQITTKEEAIQLFSDALDPNIKNEKVEAFRNAGLVNAAVALFIALEKDQTDVSQARKYFTIAQDILLSGKVFQLVQTLKSLKG